MVEFIKRKSLPNYLSIKLLTGIDPLWDSHSTIDLSLFYNDNISQDLKMHDDYINYKSGQGFSFLNYPFVLQPHVKSIGLHFANRLALVLMHVHNDYHNNLHIITA